MVSVETARLQALQALRLTMVLAMRCVAAPDALLPLLILYALQNVLARIHSICLSLALLSLVSVFCRQVLVNGF